MPSGCPPVPCSLLHLQPQRGPPLVSYHQSVLWALLQTLLPQPLLPQPLSLSPYCLSPYHLRPYLSQLPEQDLCSQPRKGHHQAPTPNLSLPLPSHPLSLPLTPHPFTPAPHHWRLSPEADLGSSARHSIHFPSSFWGHWLLPGPLAAALAVGCASSWWPGPVGCASSWWPGPLYSRSQQPQGQESGVLHPAGAGVFSWLPSHFGD